MTLGRLTVMVTPLHLWLFITESPSASFRGGGGDMMVPVPDSDGQKSQPLSGRSSRASNTDDLQGHVPHSRRSSPLSAQQKPPKPPPPTPPRTRWRSRTRWDVASCGDGGSHSWITQTGASSNADKRSRREIAKSKSRIGGRFVSKTQNSANSGRRKSNGNGTGKRQRMASQGDESRRNQQQW